MQERPIVELIEERLQQGDIHLPVFNQVVWKLQKTLDKKDYQISDVANILYKDQALASRVLEAANASFYAGLSPVKTVRDACVRIGSKGVLNIVVVVTQKNTYGLNKGRYKDLIGQLWSHALGVALGARWLAGQLGMHKLMEESFLSGLLHDIGKLLLIKILEDLHDTNSLNRSIPDTLLQEILGSMHCEKGAQLLAQQNMPEIYTQVVSRHHDSNIEADNVVINLVRMADLTCRKLGIGPTHDPGLMLSTAPEAVNLMADDLLLAKLQVELEEKKRNLEKVL